MLNPFPIQFLAPLAYFILRVFIGVYFVRTGIRGITETQKISTIPQGTRVLYHITAGASFVSGIMFLFGWYTQIAALIGIMLAILNLRESAHTYVPVVMPRAAAFLSLGVSLALFITGAGAFAFDLPI